MTLPDFLENDFRNTERTTNQFQKFHKTIHFNLFLMKYLTTIFLCFTKISTYKTSKIEKYLVKNFLRPTEGTWYDLFTLLIDSCQDISLHYRKIIKNKIEGEETDYFLLNYFKYLHDIDRHDKSLNIMHFFNKIITLKNRLVSHGTVSEEVSKKLTEPIITIDKSIIDLLSDIFNIPFYLIEEDQLSSEFSIIDINNINGQKVETNIIERDFVNNGIYSIIS